MKKPTISKKSKTDLKRLAALEDKNIDLSEIPAITPKMFAKAVVRRNLEQVPRKEQLTLRIDSDVVKWYRRQGPGYQTRINLLLRAYMEEHLKKSA
jgi:uncharacterized protein (DUF4415 family)